MSDSFYDYTYEVWRHGGNPDAVSPDEVPQDFDWVVDEPLPRHLPVQHEEGE